MPSATVIPELNLKVAYSADLNDVCLHMQTSKGLLVKGLKVFRAGTFRDSMGRRKTWTPQELADIVSNFTKLKSILPNVPVRMDHTRSVKDVGGYFESVSTDGKFIYADIIFTDPAAAAKYEAGTLRNRSFEVGPYRDNDDVVHNPVCLGLAFVDLGAVEGLYAAGDTALITDTESTMTDAELQAAFAAFYAQGLVDAEAAAATYHAAFYAHGLNDGAAAVQPHTFALASGATADFAAVQTYITALELAAAEQRNLNRAEYVNKLITEKKVAAPMKDGMLAQVATFSNEQFDAFRGMWDLAPAIPMFQKFDGTSNHQGGNGTTGEPTQDDKIQIAKEQIAQHRASGLAPEKIAATPSFMFLKSLNITV